MSTYSQSEIDRMKDESSLLRWNRDRLIDRLTVTNRHLELIHKQIYQDMLEEEKERLDNEIRDLQNTRGDIIESLSKVIDRIQELDAILSIQYLPRK